MSVGALAGKTAIVTGGAGAIGQACAEALLRDGAAVLIMGRRTVALAAAREALLAAVPDGRVEIHAGSALDTDEFVAAATKAKAMADRLDIVVATVGGGGFKPLLMHDAASILTELNENIVSAFIALRYSVPLMTRGGSFVCISSTAATMPFAYLSAYCTAKAGLEGFVRTAADELAAAGIRVNAVRPGLTRSAATGGMFADPEVFDRFLEQLPLGRGGEPEDIAAGVRYLAGPESSWVTGQSFAVDGGNELRRNPDLTGIAQKIYGKDTIDRVRQGKLPD